MALPIRSSNLIGGRRSRRKSPIRPGRRTYTVGFQKPLKDMLKTGIRAAVRDESVRQLPHAVSLNGRYGRYASDHQRQQLALLIAVNRDLADIVNQLR